MFGAKSLLGPFVGLVLGWLLTGYGVTGRLWVAVGTYLLWLTAATWMEDRPSSGGTVALVLVLSLPAVVPVALVLWGLARTARERKKEHYLRIGSVLLGLGILLFWTLMGWWS